MKKLLVFAIHMVIVIAIAKITGTANRALAAEIESEKDIESNTKTNIIKDTKAPKAQEVITKTNTKNNRDLTNNFLTETPEPNTNSPFYYKTAQKTIKTSLCVEETWTIIMEEYKRIEEKIKQLESKEDTKTDIAETILFESNYWLPKQGGLKVKQIEGENWYGELRTLSIPKNINRKKNYLMFGMSFESKASRGIKTFPNQKRTLEYLNFGGDWLGYNQKDTEDFPRIIKK